MNTTDKKLGSLTKRAEFLFVRAGRYQAQGGIVVQVRPNPAHATIRVRFTATKKVGNAVIRNRAKRRLREIARALLPQLGQNGHDYVFIARSETPVMDWKELQVHVEKALLALK